MAIEAALVNEAVQIKRRSLALLDYQRAASRACPELRGPGFYLGYSRVRSPKAEVPDEMSVRTPLMAQLTLTRDALSRTAARQKDNRSATTEPEAA